MTSQTDIRHMRAALVLARRGLGRTAPNPSVGCVVVNKAGHVVGRAVTGDGGRPHAEKLALEQAGYESRNGSVYVSFEPCAHHGQTPPCTGFIIESGVKRVVVACEDPDPRVAGKGIRQLKVAGLEVKTDVLKEEAEELNRGFVLRVTENRPLVTIKSATSANGKIAEKEGVRTQITGERAMMRAQIERSKHDAILVGINTVLVDDPLLTTRIPGHEHHIARVVLDGEGRLPKDSQLHKTENEHPLILLTNKEVDTRDLKAVLALLAERGITRLLVEGGAKVNTAFLEAGFCDRFLHFKSPKEIGRQGVDALAGYDISDIEKDFGLKKVKSSSLGEDLLEIYGHRA